MAQLRLSAKEAKQLALNAERAGAREPTAPRPRRTPLPWHHRCHDCGEEFFTEAAEVRHLNDTAHHRYELVIEEGTNDAECDPAGRDALPDEATAPG